MSVSSEVQRTLVKSPPELWAELSDPVTLARHLGELGEIRILGTEPERAVVWEAAGADGAAISGQVEIEPSGWGTRVTLSASRTIVAPGPAEGEAEGESKAEGEGVSEGEGKGVSKGEGKGEAVSEPERKGVKPEPVTELELVAEPVAEATPEPGETSGPGVFEPESIVSMPASEPTSASEPESAPTSGQASAPVEPEITEPEPRPGFFVRLFRRRHNRPRIGPEPELADEPQLAAGLEQAAEPEQDAEPEHADAQAADADQAVTVAIEDSTLEDSIIEDSIIEETAHALKEPAPEETAPALEEPAPQGTAHALEEPAHEETSPEELVRDEVPEPSIAAELAELEEQTTAVLTGVLDRLGAAHHRPFSRA